uniref:Transmembrane protein n=1 Tax=Caenorhabditis tropicalis TaxID=1561998 RepID=A0A1I7TW16_9PELO
MNSLILLTDGTNQTERHRLQISPGWVQFMEIYITFTTTTSNFLFILLIIYKRRKTADNEKELHAPIFNQLFYVSTLSLFMIDLCYILGKFAHTDTTKNIDAGLWMAAILMYIEFWSHQYNYVISTAIILFSFLAVVQMSIISFKPAFKSFVTGDWLKIEIFVVYVIIVHYLWIISKFKGFFVQKRDDC